MTNSINKVKGFDSFVLKLIAILGMTSNHFGIVFEPFLPLWLKTLLFSFGGLTFPIMAYLLVQGYQHTSDVRKYGLRIAVFALVTQLPYMWAMESSALNVLFTLLMGLLVLYLYDHVRMRLVFWLLFILITLVTIPMDWGLVGPPMVLLYGRLQGRWKRVIIPVLLPIVITLIKISFIWSDPIELFNWLPDLAFTSVGCSLTIPLLANYNGKRGRSMTYWFYLYYPVHLFLLALIARWF